MDIGTPCMNRVVITGMGWITPMGHSIDAVWKRLLKGESGIARTSIFDAATFPTTISAEVKDTTSKTLIDAPMSTRDPAAIARFGVGAQYAVCPWPPATARRGHCLRFTMRESTANWIWIVLECISGG